MHRRTGILSLLTGSALKWYWQVLEDMADVYDFGYFSLKRKMTRAFSTAESDYVTIKDLMERRQGYNESLDDYIPAMHNLNFKMRNKTPESESILKENLNTQPGAYLVVFPINSLAEFRKK